MEKSQRSSILSSMPASLRTSQIGDSEFSFSAGTWAQQANGSVCASYGDTVVLATACMVDEPTPERGFFPLTVEYQERTYAMGKIPGGFFKKEGRPKDSEILTARLIDRPLRPLFPFGMTNEVQLVAMVLSSDGKNDPDVLAINAASCALLISDIPYVTPVGAVRVARGEQGAFMVNPTYEQRQGAIIDLAVVGTENNIVMLEGSFQEALEADVLAAVKFAQPFIKELISLQKQLAGKIGKEKKKIPLSVVKPDLCERVRGEFSQRLEAVYTQTDKKERQAAVTEIIASLTQRLVTETSGVNAADVAAAVAAVEEEILRKEILLHDKRPDGRSLHELRTITCSVRVLPRTHGSAIFSRGQTQSLAVVTLGSSADEQFIEALEGESTKHFMLHYSFPPFSVGEVKPMRGPSRREVGHGALAEKALAPVIPPKEVFPYTIRVVSEILESNGSSSMASACAASLSLMDAGIPIREAVAGIAIGLVTDGTRFKILTDIAGAEDYLGDMDFKIAGTKNGITAIQLDTKTEGLSDTIIEESLARAKVARLKILEEMNRALTVPRDALSPYAPKIKSFEIDPDKIGMLIGPGGKTIKKLQRENNVTIEIDDETSVVSVAAETVQDLERAVQQITNLVREVVVGDIYEVKVERIVNFGAFAEIAPGKSGLIHVSEIAEGFVKDVSDHLKLGDVVKVKVVGIDPQGKIRLSIKQAK